MDAANFLFKHPRGPIYGSLTPQGIRELRLPRGGRGDSAIYLLHSCQNIALGLRLHDTLERYFAGLRVDFADIPLDIAGATDFQREVWQTARQVSHGTTSTYGALARLLGREPGASRAVGRALGANPIAIVVPCHRFIASTGKLVNYAAGLEWKRELLQLEGAIIA
jgi:O-6-methylguanine DNA methyltransferase